MLKWPLWILSKVGTVVMVGYIAWLGWQTLGPKKPEFSPLRRELADRGATRLAAQIDVPANAGRRSGHAYRLRF
jgi:hypothetical protein